MKSRTIGRRGIWLGALVLAVAPLAACSQDTADDTGSESASTEAAGTEEGAVATTAAGAEMPAPFDGDVKIAVVQNSGAGDYFQQWTNGAKQQADALGIEYTWYDAQADNAKQANDMETAIGSGVDGIVVDHGQTDTMCPLINQALEAGIPVVIYDIAIADCAPDAVQTQQSDASLADLSLGQMLEDIGADQNVGYVNVLGIAPLDRRHVVWEEYKTANSWNEMFFVGEYTNAVATDNAQLVDAALKANADVRAIFAPYDELTKGSVSAINDAGLADKIWAYGIDISNADIEVMTTEGSPWKATATTDPNAIGAAVMRTMALELAGQQEARSVDFPGVLVTQQFLLDNSITNMEELRAAMPELNLADVQSADWIPSVTF
ncbi:MAG: sugar ABC transporter substrate-binding protein [Ilumatobacter coccineus]|uniref:Sugar ABC transporter substrate-binding protein n=1 Tax=Ilumatobacter coccineus TaxID=467094 RepID=A0A2G6K8C0_9ACTN|nr:MAG: sugar ABC transporter substrate-binding protein [Ilumatobacter coccineus]